MSEQEKKRILQVMTGEENEDVVYAYLTLAGKKVIKAAYPYDSTVETVPEKYVDNQLNIAAYLINKRGAEGETSHSENGVSRSYEDADVPSSMLRDIIPMVKVVGGGTL